MLSRDRDCLLPVEEAGVLWDSVCFLFLLLQRRVFLSRYFLHVRAELQATALQASRSAPPGCPGPRVPAPAPHVARDLLGPSASSRPALPLPGPSVPARALPQGARLLPADASSAACCHSP